MPTHQPSAAPRDHRLRLTPGRERTTFFFGTFQNPAVLSRKRKPYFECYTFAPPPRVRPASSGAPKPSSDALMHPEPGPAPYRSSLRSGSQPSGLAPPSANAAAQIDSPNNRSLSLTVSRSNPHDSISAATAIVPPRITFARFG